MANPFLNIFSGALGEANTQRQNTQQLQQALQTLVFQAKIRQMFDPEAQFRNQIMKLISGQGGGQPGMGQPTLQPQQPSGNMNMGGGFQPKGFNYGGFNFERQPTEQDIQRDIGIKVQETKATELAKGIPTSETGKAALARESLKNISDVKNILFPTGEAKSFKRATAYGSNLPGGQFPILPSVAPFRKNPQEVFRKVGAALSGRQLIQTGVAARTEETAKLMSQFAPNLFSNPEAALNGLDELEAFYKDYLYILETKGLQTAEEWAKSLTSSPQSSNQGRQDTPSQRINRVGKYTFQ